LPGSFFLSITHLFRGRFARESQITQSLNFPNHSILPTLFSLVLIHHRLRNPVLLARPRPQIEQSAPLAAKRKIRILFGIRRRLADGTSVFHASWILSQEALVGADLRVRPMECGGLTPLCLRAGTPALSSPNGLALSSFPQRFNGSMEK
jgi:hypothetical protein